MATEISIDISKDEHLTMKVRARGNRRKVVGFTKIWFTVKNSEADEDPGLLQLNSETNPDSFDIAGAMSSGIAYISISPAELAGLDIGRYLYSIKVLTTHGEAKEILRGEIGVKRSITRAFE